MWVDLLSMLATGAFTACLVFIIGRLLRKQGRPLPRWAMPCLIGASMIVYSIWSEYTWFERVQASLPEQVVVTSTGERSAPWAPWTYLAPVTIRFAALDGTQRQTSEERPGLIRTRLLLVERWSPTRTMNIAIDCPAQRWASLPPGASIRADGTLTGSNWQALTPSDPLLRAACGRERS